MKILAIIYTMNESGRSREMSDGTICGNSGFGLDRICYVNFAGHLQNAYNPNVLYHGLPNRWSDGDWRGFIDMVVGFGFTAFEFWLVPHLFCREGLN